MTFGGQSPVSVPKNLNTGTSLGFGSWPGLVASYLLEAQCLSLTSALPSLGSAGKAERHAFGTETKLNVCRRSLQDIYSWHVFLKMGDVIVVKGVLELTQGKSLTSQCSLACPDSHSWVLRWLGSPQPADSPISAPPTAPRPFLKLFSLPNPMLLVKSYRNYILTPSKSAIYVQLYNPDLLLTLIKPGHLQLPTVNVQCQSKSKLFIVINMITRKYFQDKIELLWSNSHTKNVYSVE